MKRWIVAALLVAGAAFPAVAVAQGNPSIRETLPRARAGDAGAQYMTGMMYLFGQGTGQNMQEAARWLQASAKGGVPQAMVAMAALYDVGVVVPFDAARATELRQQAARAGNATARAQLNEDATMRGFRDFRRANTLTDLKLYAQAVPFARKAAAAGSASGQLLLGRAYHFALGVPVDKAAALKLYVQSSDGGLADGSRAVGYMYEFGQGVGVDRRQALRYYDLAAARGSKIARINAANLRSPDYDRPRQGMSGGNSSSNSEFQRFQCNGAGGQFNGTSCYQANTNTIITPP